MKKILLLSAALLAIGPLNAEPMTFICNYPNWSDENGNHKSKGEFILTFIIDENSHKAYMLGNLGSVEVLEVKSDGQISFIQQTEKTGAKVDLELIETYKSLLNNKIQELDKTIKEKYGNWNYNSNPQLANFLFNQLKLPILEKTPTGRPKCDEVVLEKLSAVCELPKYLLEIRKYKKALSTYVEGLRKSVWKDGKIHTQFLVHGTETGRLSSIKPNFQNWPRFDPKSYLGILGINIKNLVVSSDDDYYIVETDYSQAELRLIAEYSRDNNLYNAFLNDRDPHAELAVRLYHKEYIADMESGKVSAKELYKKGIITKEERTKGKTANFSLCYGKFAENFAKEENIPLEEAREIHRVYWETYPGITSWKERTLEEGRKNGYFKSFFGRKRRLPNINSEDKFLRGSAEREGINFVIQSQASDYTLYSTIKVMKKAKELGLNCRNISFVHDSAVYEVKKSDIQEFLNILQDIMTKCVGVSLKMEAEVKIGNRLGSCKEWIKKDGVWQENKK
jgi:DNA polymerase-1